MIIGKIYRIDKVVIVLAATIVVGCATDNAKNSGSAPMSRDEAVKWIARKWKAAFEEQLSSNATLADFERLLNGNYNHKLKGVGFSGGGSSENIYYVLDNELTIMITVEQPGNILARTPIIFRRFEYLRSPYGVYPMDYLTN